MDGRTDPLLETLKQAPEDPEVLRSLQAKLVSEGRTEELSRVMEWWASMAPDDAAASDALLDAARVIEGQPRHVERVTALLERALQRNPAAYTVASRLEALLRAQGDHETLARILQRQALDLRLQGRDPELCAEASYRLGYLLVHQLHEVDAAIAVFEDGLRTCPTHRESRRALATLYAKRGYTYRTRSGLAVTRDHQRAAELWYSMTDEDTSTGKGEPLMRAAELEPRYRVAISDLEQVSEPRDRDAVLGLWDRYVQDSAPGVYNDARRMEVARALVERNRNAEAARHLQKLARQGHEEARALLEELGPQAIHEETAPRLAMPTPIAETPTHTFPRPDRLRHATWAAAGLVLLVGIAAGMMLAQRFIAPQNKAAAQPTQPVR